MAATIDTMRSSLAARAWATLCAASATAGSACGGSASDSGSLDGGDADRSQQTSTGEPDGTATANADTGESGARGAADASVDVGAMGLSDATPSGVDDADADAADARDTRDGADPTDAVVPPDVADDTTSNPGPGCSGTQCSLDGASMNVCSQGTCRACGSDMECLLTYGEIDYICSGGSCGNF
jgi:hypothetical protein